MRVRTFALVAALLAAAVIPARAQTPAAARHVDGTVVDTQGLPIVGAQITLTMTQGNVSRTAASSAEGFRFENVAPGSYTLRVTATGFQSQQMAIDLSTATARTVDVKLEPAGIREQTVVTATRSEHRVADVPASVSVVGNEQIQQSPAVVADDVLRQVPTFSLFRGPAASRRNRRPRESRSRHRPERRQPHAGAARRRAVQRSVRRLGLLDARPLMSSERIEIVDGATSSLYGNYAMGGVINIVTNRAMPATVIFKPQYGNRGTPKMDLFASDVWGKLGVTFDATTLRTDGYKIVAPEERGPIDNEANVRYQSGSGKVEYNPTDRVNLFFRFGVFDEDRNNGKSAS
jgi:outer membrane receptor protein involved in Fe transport